jgi:hypothetical protein
MHGNAEKGLDDSLLFQTMVGFFFCKYSRGGLKRNLTSFDYAWAWFSHYNTNIGISNRSWVRHGHLTYSYFTCTVAIGYHLLQTIQGNF